MLNDIGGFLADSDVRSHPERLEEMIDAAGGSMDDFAPLILGYLRGCTQQQSPDPDLPLDYVHHVLTFIKHADAFPVDCEHEWMTIPVGSFGRALYEADFAEELVSAVLLFCDGDKPHDDAQYAIDGCMKLMYRMVFMSSPAFWAEFLERGFLRALVLITLKCETHGWRLNHYVRFFLQVQLPPALVYYYIVGTLEESLEKVRGLISGDDFKRCAVYAQWQHFLAHAQERLDAHDEFAFRTVAYKTCDNLRCGSIEYTECIAGRCSGCQAFYYCSRRCQKVDWKAGHRTFCDSHQRLLLTQKEQRLLFVERSFLRYLVHRKYLNERRSILAQQVTILAAQTVGERGAPPVLFTLFDFQKSPPLITVYIADVGLEGLKGLELKEPDGTPSPEWEDLVERARRSQGRMQLHGVRILESPPHVWVIPLRSESAEGYERLLDLAGRVRAGEVEETGVPEEIEGILGSLGNVVEVH
ncbi:hypothetical protein FB45DRAFT_268020 [Roridomyces roridus]|uniref:MYND-type domain-containing protein n=1 Tax=Roridomyces roridus TaxID=1738132 RepID=A0AAD7FDF6_9AGAR|nr:hypothetical protein FB45DRAFT_268020 [Roridomyces roridus]